MRSLLDGLAEGDRLVHLQRRLHSLPTDLEKYFEHTLFSTVDLETYKAETARMFLVALKAHDTLPLMSYWFIDQDGPELATKIEVKPWSMQRIRQHLKNAEKRVSACCKGLLEVHFYDSENKDDVSLSSSVLFNWKVDFLHRTVRDFLMKADVKKKLEGWTSPGFNVNIVICEAMLAQIKTCPRDTAYFETGGPIWKLTTIFHIHAGLPPCNLADGIARASLEDELAFTLHQHELWTRIDWRIQPSIEPPIEGMPPVMA